MDERALSTSTSQPPPTPEVSSNQIPSQSSDRPPFQSPGYPDVEGSHKRKRSDSVELRHEHAQHAHTPESAHPHHESREPYGTPSRDYRPYGDEHRDKESWYSHQARDERSYDSQQNSATTPHGQTEEQIGDALRRATGQMDHGDYSNASPEGDDHSMIYGGQYGSEQRRDGRKKSAMSRSPSQSPYGNQPVKRESLPPYRGQALRIDPPQGRPLVTDDDRPTASTLPSASVASPENKLSALPYTPANVFPTPVSANPQPPPPFGERMAKEYQRVPPLHDLSRTEPESAHLGNQLPQINILHPTRTNSPAPPPPAPTSNAQVAAQLALSHSQFPQRRTQKEEMLSGRHYYPFDKELCLERERCSAACWRFNNLTTPPTNGVSPEERARLFLEILQPRDPVRVSPTEASPVTNVGRVGRHVAVETPFICDYGYNITIGHHVVIGRNCTINDVCEVKIGDNCVIGPNVSIFTAGLPIDPKKRQGGQGPQMGKPITIEQDCWIGGGAIILPGRTIGKGSTVGAGSIVTKDVPPFTIVAGNPARVLRGIAS
ncbi:hypothetical protein FOXG_05432 [Fusarium oxysporum f. sp. lycopersici 4287]|uniref:Maltose/galactoside acetyltransferase domain-containing protein n=2 Tax=Fusarium oxysporum TaxID=5507 RepID=A0A0J9USU9_FUSO4|nr:hypothetical protein FOXG_05432 [Fusarium oxysporum f. sp. lycopersici 4287]KNB02659.1 hypothetical protein FOXG_05432 [Fusarium oxysporum f. sp. lycopersici 4287]